MPFPYLLMAGLYALLAGLIALDASLASFSLLPWFNGLRWLRVHVITLGILAQAAFGLLPALLALRAGRPRPVMRWDIWLGLNLGLPLLLIGIPLVNAGFILTGGSLIFAAGTALLRDLTRARPDSPAGGPPAARPFYVAGLGFLLLGIFMGTGLWLGWGEALRVAVPKEVHIHANLWGFSSLFLAGLIVDFYPGFAGRQLAWPRSVPAIFGLLTLAGLMLVLGPWLGSMYFTAPGMVLLWLGTVWLLANVVVPLRALDHWRAPGMWHVVTAYAWLLTPVLLMPLVSLEIVGMPGASAEQSAPPALVYGWLLQFAYAVLPFLLRRWLMPDQPARLGGSWFSLVAVHLGVILTALSIFNVAQQAQLQGAAYAAWAASVFPAAIELWRPLRAALARLDEQSPQWPAESAGPSA
jgi:cytochrome c oxidase cbb3-type subunit I